MDSNLTRSQWLIWTGQCLYPDQPLYNMPLAFTIHGEIDLQAFVDAAKRVTSICDSFRTVFEQRDGQPWRTVLSEVESPLRCLDFSREPDPEQSVSAWLNQRARQALPLDRSLTDLALLKVSPRKSVLYFNQHHLVTDGFSAARVYQVLNRAYQAIHANQAPPSESVPPFDSYAAHERSAAASTIGRQAQDHWRGLARSPLPETVVLHGRSLIAESIKSDRVTIRLGVERTMKLKELIRSLGARGLTEDLSLFQALAALVFAYLFRVTGQQFLSIAAPAHNRPTASFKHSVGLFMELFPLELQLPAEASFLDMIVLVREATLRYLRFAAPGTSGADLANRSQVLFNFVNASFGEFAGFPTEVEWLHPGCGDRQHPLRIAVHDFARRNDFTALFDFNAEVFGAKEQEWTVRHFLCVLDAVLSDASQPIRSINLLTEDEQRRALVWNQTRQDYRSDVTLIDLFAAQARKHPNRIAISGLCLVDGYDTALTYSELDARSDHMASLLQRHGLEPGDRVVLQLPSSVDFVVCVLATLKLGGIYVPLAENCPAGRRDFILQDTEAKILLAHVDPPEPSSGPEVIRLPVALEDVKLLPRLENRFRGAATDICYIIYTSGSTGEPKGVCCRHQGVINLIDDLERRAPLPEPAKTSWWTSPSFDVSVYEIWSALAHGRALYILAEDTRLAADKCFAVLAKECINGAYLPAFMLQDLADVLESGILPRFRLKRLLVGVEPISEKLLGRIKASLPELTIVNGYGPTETTVCCALHTVDFTSGDDRVTPIGRPVQNHHIYLLDSLGQLVTPGSPGEVHVAGPGVAAGYWRRPRLTQERFINSPFVPKFEDKLFRTGDMARQGEDGNLLFMGRRDHQVKVRGHRIELNEVAMALERRLNLREAVARPWPPDNPTHLVAYVTPREPNGFDGDLRARLEHWLPDYMIPTRYVVMDSLPRNQSHKVDMSALPDPEPIACERETLNTGSWAERLLVDLWRDALKLTSLNVTDNFFYLGGDSIISIQIAARALERGLAIRPGDFFRYQTIRELAANVERAERLAERVDPPTEAHIPLTPIQGWFFSLSSPEPSYWNNQVVLEWKGALDIARLRSALNQALARHDAFSLSFHPTESGWLQMPKESSPSVTISEFDSSIMSLEQASEELHSSMRIDQAPLFRSAIVRNAAEPAARLLLVAHHLVVDAVSWRVLLADLESAYENEAPSAPSLPFARWARERSLVTSRVSPRLAAPIPTDFVGVDESENLQATQQTITCALDADSSSGILQRSGGSAQEWILLSVAMALARWMNSLSLWIDMEQHGRDDARVAGTVGWFTRLTALHVKLANFDDPGKNLWRIKDALLQAKERAASPSDAMVRPSILLNYLGRIEHYLSDAKFWSIAEPLTLRRSPRSPRGHLLEVDAIFDHGELRFHWNYSSRFHRGDTVKRLADHALAILRHVASADAAPSLPQGITSIAGVQSAQLGKLEKLLRKADTSVAGRS